MTSTVVLPEYNSSMPDGGDPAVVDVNAPFTGLEFHYVYLFIMGCLVFLIIPGIGLLYGGMARRKSALAMVFQSFTVLAVVTFQWMFWGFSLAFSREVKGGFIGDLSYFGLRNMLAAPSGGSVVIPDVVFCFYELMFAGCATMIVVGGSFERGRILPSIIFSFCWVTIVYCPIACWTWNAGGWLYQLPALDFAGGGPVHISSGCAGLAYALVLGKRSRLGERHVHKPHNVTIVFLGTVLIWFGWFGFNGGSALNATMRSMVAAYNTNVAACFGVIGWTLVGLVKNRGKFSVIGACEGVVAGLVGITPAAGYVSFWLAAVIGFLTAVVVALLDDINKWLHIDDGLMVFKLHGIGGMVGAFLTGCFASSKTSSLDGLGTQAPGAVDGNGVQVGHQLAEICAIASWSFVVSCLVLLALKYTPGLHLRVQDEVEMVGMDLDQFCDETLGEWSSWETDGGHARHTPGQVIEGLRASMNEERTSQGEPVTKVESSIDKPGA